MVFSGLDDWEGWIFSFNLGFIFDNDTLTKCIFVNDIFTKFQAVTKYFVFKEVTEFQAITQYIDSK